MPRAFALFVLITSSNFTGCSTGSSAGFAPLEDTVDVERRAAVMVDAVGPERDQCALFDKLAVAVHYGQPKLLRPALQVSAPPLLRSLYHRRSLDDAVHPQSYSLGNRYTQRARRLQVGD